MKAAALVFAALLLAAISTPAHAASVPDLQRYTQSIHATRLQLEGLLGNPKPPVASVQSITRRLRSLDRVRLPDGAIITTDSSRLADLLAPGDQTSVRQATQAVEALDGALQTTTPAAAGPDELATLDSVLKDPRFQTGCTGWGCVTDWLGGQINRFLTWLADRLHVSVPSFVVGGLNLAPVFGIVFVVLVGFLGYLIVQGALKRLVVEVPPPQLGDEGLSAPQAEDRADTAARAGDLRTALRYLFLSTMLDLQARQVLELRPGLTNREYVVALRDAARYPALREPLEHLVDAFDRTWYGHLRLDEAGYARCRQWAAQAIAAAAQRAA